MLLASLAFDHEPLKWAQLPGALLLWLQNAGGVATLGLGLWLLTRSLERVPVLILPSTLPPQRRSLLTNVFVGGTLLAIAAYAPIVIGWLMQLAGFNIAPWWFPRSKPDESLTVGDYCLLIGGGCALAIVAAPILYNACTSMRFGRIWAIARLSLKESIRGRIIWIFGAMSLIFLFADWFVTYKPEDQVRNYVRVVYWSMTPLFLLTAALLGSFSIPAEVKNYSIHTIVTKPVEKFEIVLGRFLGHGILLTVGLLVISCLSLGYVVRGINEKARKESYKARDVVYGHLHFAGTKDAQKGELVGREWSYRSYIRGATPREPKFRQFAIWDFAEVPADLGRREGPIHFEFSFDIFRLTKGEKEGEGVHATFTFADGTRRPEEVDAIVDQMKEEQNIKVAAARKVYDKALQNKANSPQEAEKEFSAALDAIKLDLLKKYRIHQVVEKVEDFHTQEIDVPSSVFEVLLATPDARPVLRDLGEPAPPQLRVFVQETLCKQPQMLGVAKQDFYLVAHEKPFWQNFLKGIVGMWCTVMLVLGIAIACSTYLSGVISLLATLFLYCTGLCTDYLHEIAERRLDQGGPSESFIRVFVQMPIAKKLEDSPTKTLVETLDGLFYWWIGRFMNMVPDMNRHDLHPYVANGFDIGWVSVLFLDNFLPLCGYLVPWAILAYYLMKYREIGDPS